MLKARILVVEDEGIVAEDIRQVLIKLGYYVIDTVADGDEAIKLVQEEKPDLVLMDIVLKGEKTGIEAAKEIYKFNVPVIYLTAYADETTIDKAKMTAPFGFILKPFEEQELKSTIEMALYKHKMEMRLREKELWFSTTLMSIGDGVIATDVKSKIILMNSIAENLTGWNQKDAKGQPLGKVFNLVKEDGAKIDLDIADVFKRGRLMSLPAETYLLSRNGSKIPIDDSIAPITDQILGITGAVVVFHNIVERKLVERALKESEERYRSLFEESHDAIYITTRNGQFVLVNQSALELFHYTKEEIVKLNIKDLFVDEDAWKEFKLLIEENESVKDFEVEFYNKERDSIYCILTASLRKDDDGEVHGYQGIIRDVTDKKRSELEREKIKAQLMQAQKMEAIGVLAGGVAHDFNNLLTIIQGNIDLALMRMDKEQDKELFSDLTAAQDASLRAADLTSQLLLFSRKQPMRFVKEDLNQIIEDMLKMLHRLIGEDISIKTDLSDELLKARIDRGSIEQLIMNLAVNARDAMPDGGEIRIKTCNAENGSLLFQREENSNYVMFSFSDTGMGIEDEVIDHVFDPFFTTKGPGKGTGLGLSVVYGIVQQHGGWIDVESQIGKGTVFTIYIPVATDDIEDLKRSRIDEDTIKGNGERILVIEDEEGVKEFVCTALTKYGYKIFQASTLAAAREQLEQRSAFFDLVLCDVVLPDGNGLNLLEEKYFTDLSIPIIFSSGYTGEKSRWETIRDKGIPFIQKPFTVNELLVKIKDTFSL
ncbi:response regulator [bacterium]|nr:response regulator [bacterium]